MAIELKPRIVVIGVGGAGGNAVNNMIDARLQGVEFIAANTDAQALARSKAPVHIQLGVGKTQGLGAGANPDVGSEAAKESSEEIKKLLVGAHMCFIAAGMGGGTGTGAAPIIARIAREQKVLTVGVVTKPFDFEGKRRMATAERGIVDLRAEVDTLIIIPNQNLFRIASRETTFAEAFHMADQVLYSGVRGITDLMVMPGLINLDFADVRTVMAAMGTAMMGTGEMSGENRALKAAQAAIANPLLDDVSMKGAKGVLINITGGYDMTLFEVDEAANEIRREVDADAHIILGSTFDEDMSGKIRVSVVAAGITPESRAAAQRQPSREAPTPAFAPAVQIAAPPPAQIAAPPPAQIAAPPPVIEPHVRVEAPEPLILPAPNLSGPNAPGQARPASPIIRTRQFAAEIGAPMIGDAEEDDIPAIMLKPQPAALVSAPESAPATKSFASLFGWRPKPVEGPVPPPPPPKPAVADDAFEDELEIPAFLRRSANT